MKATKQQQIETWLLNGQPLTAEIAFEKFGCRNLSLMILQLRKKGMKIDTETVLKNGSRYGRYVLAK